MTPEPGMFYLGGRIAPESGERTESLMYDSDDLVTHGVIVGMTGSGKTGLGIGLLEEALRARIPCLVIDPKGDMGNLRLIFPDFQPSDFAPWVDPGTAERAGSTVEELAAETATRWKDGLAAWNVTPDAMRSVREGSDVTIYTPGSTAGVPLNILGSLEAPSMSWDEHAEEMRDEIEGFVSSLLVLAGIEADPVSSPSHILLATIIETSWRAGRSLDLAALLGQIQEPPFRKLGVFELDIFYPKKDRTALAMKLNGLLASPSFAAWLEGEPLSIDRLLTGGEKTKAAVIYLAHLSDSERQFVVTLLLAKLTTWMRGQSGTSKLRALVYMDEVFGFAPPVAEPPSKKQILTILKQARAFGVGMVLATQNPVDLDYKAMSNAGTWMVGRLQTENDKKRILEGLADAGGSTDTTVIDTLISNLEKRQFVLRQTRSSGPTVFVTRWAMSYLAGPLDKTKVAGLTPDRSAARATDPGPNESDPVASAEAEATDRIDAVGTPPVAEGVAVFSLDPAAAWAAAVGSQPDGSRWKAVGVATVHLLYDDRHAGVDHREDYEVVIDPLSERIDEESIIAVDHDPRDFVEREPKGEFITPDAPIDKASFWKSLQVDLRGYLARTRTITVWKNPALSLYSRVGETREDFEKRCGSEADKGSDADVAKLAERYEARITRVKDQISRADRRVAELSADLGSRQQEEVMSGVGDFLGSLIGGKSASGALRRASTRRSKTRRTTADLTTAEGKLLEERQELADLEAELESEVANIVDNWTQKATQIEELQIPLEESDVDVADLQLVWVPVE